MSFLSVSAKKTRVHLSPDNLSTTSESSHSQQDDFVADCVALPIKNSFIQIYKSSRDSWINICKIKKDDGKENIQLIVKNKVDSLAAIGASKKKSSGLCFASGYTNGQIKIRDLQTSKLVKEFAAPPNASSSSVFFLDFNSSDEHLASVHENGQINVFGMQTGVKLHSFELDKQSTLARFHPQKRSLLGVASYSGKVSVLDIYAKKTVFKVDAHSAPCSDIAMSEDYLLSSGYDSTVKIFDLRKKSPGIQIQATYGWTSIDVSKCGVYLVGGNMKGEIISYDMRNIKKPLASARIENSNHKISRVSFLSCDDDASSTIDFKKEVRQSLCKIEEEIDGKQTAAESNDNFIEDILGFQRGRISDFSTSAINYGTRVSTASRRSSTDFYGKNMQEMLKDFSSPTTPVINVDDSLVNKCKRRMSSKDGKSIGGMLQEIDEESNDKENDAKVVNEIPTTPTVISNPRYSSTPTIAVTTPRENSADSRNEQKIVDVIDLENSLENAQNEDIPNGSESKETKVPSNFDFRKEFDALSKKIHFEVGSMNMDQNMRHIEIMSHVGEQRRILQDRVTKIEELLAILLNDDFKINLINDLQAENQQLRQQNSDLLRRLSQ